MTSDSYRFEEINPALYSDQILRLWREASVAGGLMWQDRSPEPMKLYEGWGSQPARLFGAWSGDHLVASSVLVPHFAATGVDGEEFQFIYDTDLCVSPAHRQIGLLLGLLDFRHKIVFSEMSESLREKSIFYGLSHRPDLGNILVRRFVKKTKDWGCSLGQSVLAEFACRQQAAGKPASSFAVSRNIKVPSDVPNFIIPIGRWNERHLSAIENATESFYQFCDSKVGISGFLCDFRSTRKMRWNKRAQRLLSGVAENDEVKYLIGTFTEGSYSVDSVELQEVVHQLLQFANNCGYDFLAIRDLPAATLESVRSEGLKVTTFERDLFAWGFEPSRSHGLPLVQKLASGRIQVEGLFL